MEDMEFDERTRELYTESVDITEIVKPEVQERIKNAVMVVGFDESRPQPDKGYPEWALFYGREILKDIQVGRGDEWPEHNTVAVRYDQRNDSLEILAGVIMSIHGPNSCCYGKE